MNNPETHRKLITNILSSGTLHQHQINAAEKTFSAFDNENIRAVVTAAEMQAGKSGIALALCCFQRLSLSDTDICDRKQLKDTLYLVTMPDTALRDQAEDDLKLAKNVVVSNFVNFEKALENDLKGNPPKLIIIDECHHGSNITGIRYSRIFDYLEKENDSCKVVFISATPFGALYGAETEYEEAIEIGSAAEKEDDEELLEESREVANKALKDSILRRDFGTRLVFHKTSDEYYGVREMLKNGRLIDLDDECRNFLVESNQRSKFMEQFKRHEGMGWSLIRVPAGNAMDARQYLISQGIDEHNIFILGNSLSGVPEDQLSTIDRFKKDFEDAQLFGDKLVAITVAGCRAGINFGAMMKNNLISTWDSTVASVAAVVQANVGRACGYHGNNTSMHFTNGNAAEAYGATLDYLERTCADHAASDFDGLKEFFEDICQEYHVNGAPSVKENRAMRGKKKNWIKAQWVNGDSYDNPEKAGVDGPQKERTIMLTNKIDNGEFVEFNRVVAPGSGELTEDKLVTATVFSVYNISRRKVIKTIMTEQDVWDMCDHFGIPRDDTMFVLYKRGEYNAERSLAKKAHNELPENTGTLSDESQFSAV